MYDTILTFFTKAIVHNILFFIFLQRRMNFSIQLKVIQFSNLLGVHLLSFVIHLVALIITINYYITHCILFEFLFTLLSLKIKNWIIFSDFIL